MLPVAILFSIFGTFMTQRQVYFCECKKDEWKGALCQDLKPKQKDFTDSCSK